MDLLRSAGAARPIAELGEMTSSSVYGGDGQVYGEIGITPEEEDLWVYPCA
jgi:hypothetical protein